MNKTYKLVITKSKKFIFRATLYKRWLWYIWFPIRDCRAVYTTVYLKYMMMIVIKWKNAFNISPNRIVDKTKEIIK